VSLNRSGCIGIASAARRELSHRAAVFGVGLGVAQKHNQSSASIAKAYLNACCGCGGNIIMACRTWRASSAWYRGGK